MLSRSIGPQLTNRTASPSISATCISLESRGALIRSVAPTPNADFGACFSHRPLCPWSWFAAETATDSPLQSAAMPEMDREALQQVLDQVESPYTVDQVREDGDVRLRLPVEHAHIRPGGTISGPALMAIADGAAWAAVLSHRGPDMSPVSTSLHIDFLRKPDPDDLIAEGVVLRLGRTLAVIDVAIRSAGTERLVAKAQVTYAIPPDR